MIAEFEQSLVTSSIPTEIILGITKITKTLYLITSSDSCSKECEKTIPATKCYKTINMPFMSFPVWQTWRLVCRNVPQALLGVDSQGLGPWDWDSIARRSSLTSQMMGNDTGHHLAVTSLITQNDAKRVRPWLPRLKRLHEKLAILHLGSLPKAQIVLLLRWDKIMKAMRAMKRS